MFVDIARNSAAVVPAVMVCATKLLRVNMLDLALITYCKKC